MEEALMRIGELAARAGVSVRALRYYEEQNLLASVRSPSGQRQYPDSAVDRSLCPGGSSSSRRRIHPYLR